MAWRVPLAEPQDAVSELAALGGAGAGHFRHGRVASGLAGARGCVDTESCVC